MDQPMDILREFPVRKSKRQKSAFREAILSYGEELGYRCCVEKGSMGARNLVLGDPEKAKILVTAHYDTCARLPFPNLITPCSFWLFLGWQLLLTAILCIPPGILGGLIGGLLDDRGLAVNTAYLLLMAELMLMLIGPANRHNANDNTSGVVAALELARSLSAEDHERVCFVLFDLEEAGLWGSASFRKSHRKASNGQVIFNLDCVGEGDEILLFPTKKAKKDRRLMELVKRCSFQKEGKSITVQDQGFAIYPSDQTNFPVGFGVAAFCRSKWAGLYLAKIHTGKDRNLDEKNVALLREYLQSVLSQQA